MAKKWLCVQKEDWVAVYARKARLGVSSACAQKVGLGDLLVLLLCWPLIYLVVMLASYWFGCYVGLLMAWLLCWPLNGLVAMLAS